MIGRFGVLLLALGLPVGVISCGQPSEFTLATHHSETSLADVGVHLATVVSRANDWNVQSLSGNDYNVSDNIGLVARREVDFAISSTALRTDDNVGVRTVLPLYPEILIVLYHESLGEPRTLQDLLPGKSVGVGPEELLHSTLMMGLIKDFGFSEDSFDPVYTPLEKMSVLDGEMDVLFTFVGANRSRIEEQIQKGARIFSFDDPRLDGHGSRVDGLLLKRPYLRSFIIPKNTFDRFPQEPVLTLAITVTVITHLGTSDRIVYDFVSGVLENSHLLSQKNALLGFLSGQFDETRLNFPLHEGTRQYLNRDQPSFLERYAEVIALLVTICVLTFGVLGSARSMLRRRKKERIDIYYRQVQEIAGRRPDDEESRKRSVEELRSLRATAVAQLRDESLRADESFSILLELIQQATKELESGSPHGTDER